MIWCRLHHQVRASAHIARAEPTLLVMIMTADASQLWERCVFFPPAVPHVAVVNCIVFSGSSIVPNSLLYNCPVASVPNTGSLCSLVFSLLSSLSSSRCSELKASVDRNRCVCSQGVAALWALFVRLHAFLFLARRGNSSCIIGTS